MSIRGTFFNNKDRRLNNFRKLGLKNNYADSLSGFSTTSAPTINDATIFPQNGSSPTLYVASSIGIYRTFNSTDNLTIRYPTLIAGNFTVIEEKNGLLLAGTNTGEIYSSTDGVTWVNRTNNLSSSPVSWGSSKVWSIEYGNGYYVISGVNRLAYSPDLNTWYNARLGNDMDGSPTGSYRNMSFANWQADDNNYKVFFNQNTSTWYVATLGNICFTTNITDPTSWSQVADTDFYRIFGEAADPSTSNIPGLSYPYGPIAGIGLTDRLVTLKAYGGRGNIFYQPVAFSTSTTFPSNSGLGMRWNEFKTPSNEPLFFKKIFTTFTPNHISLGPNNKKIITAHYQTNSAISRVAITTDFVTYTNLGHGAGERNSAFSYTSAMYSGSQSENTATFLKPDMAVLYNSYLKGGNNNYWPYYSPVASSYRPGDNKWVIAYDWGSQSAYLHNSVAISTDGAISWKAADHETETSIYNNYTSYVYSGIGSTDYFVLGKYSTTDGAYVEVSQDGENWYSSGIGNRLSPIYCSGAASMVSGIYTGGKYFSGHSNGKIFTTENPYVNIDRFQVPVNPNNSLEPDNLVLCLPLNAARGVNDISGIMTSYNGSSFNKTVTNNGSVGIVTTFSQYYGSSASFNGTNQTLSIASSSDFGYGTGDFTWEGWFNSASFASTNNYLLDHGSNGGVIQYQGGVLRYYNPTIGGGVLYTTGFGSGLSTGRWYHFAAVRQSGITKLYLDGVLSVSAADSHNYATNNFTVGNYGGGGGYYWNGYIQDLRVYKGLAKYTSNFAPPRLADYYQYLTFSAPLNTINPSISLNYVNTYELSAGIGSTATTLANSSVATVSNATNSIGVATYLYGENAGIGATVILTSPFTVTGTTQISTASSAYGGSSAYFDGATGNSLTGLTNPLSGIGTGNFTIEGWFNASGNGDYYTITAGAYDNGYADHMIYRTGGSWLYYSSTYGGGWDAAGGGSFGAVANGTWAHLAVEKVGTTFRLYRNGVGITTFTSNPTYSNIRPLRISTYNGSAGQYFGYIQDFRMYNRAKYNSSSSGNGVTFTPPTSYVTAAADTYSGNVAFASSLSGTNGQTNINYEAQAKRGIAFFNASTSSMTGAATTAFYFGTGDYTIECFYYKNTTNSVSNDFLFDGRVNTGSASRPLVYTNEGYGSLTSFYLNGGNRIYGPNMGGASFGSNDTLGITTDPRFDLQGRSNLNKWNHVALCRKDGLTRLYFNGKIQGVYTDTNSYDGPGMRIGNQWSGGYTFNGYIQDFQVYKGYAKYYPQENPQNDKDNWVEILDTSPLSSLLVTASSHSVRGITSRSLNGVDSLVYACNKHVGISTRIISATVGYANTINTNVFYTSGVVGIGTTSKIGSSSAKFDGSSYLGVYSQPQDLNFDTRDFSIEFWVYFNSIGTNFLWEQRPNVNGYYPLIYLNAGVLTYYLNGAARITGPTLSAGQWYHIALARTNGITKMFLNGTQTGSQYVDPFSYQSYSRTNRMTGGSGAVIGAQCDLNFKLNGFMNGLRVYNGYNGGYSTNFTPPTSVLSVSGDANVDKLKILANFNAGNGYNDLLSYQYYGKRGGVNAGLSTFGGFWNQPVSTFSAYYPQVGFGTTSKFNQGSVKFNGNSYLTFADNRGNGFNFGPEDQFSIEFWFYLESTPTTQQVIWDSRPAANGAYPLIYVDSSGYLNYNVYGIPIIGGASVGGGTTITARNWNHLCLQRKNGTTTLYLNGVQEGQLFTDNLSYPSTGSLTNPIYLGSNYVKTENLNGSIQDLKVYKGSVGYANTVGILTASLNNTSGLSTITRSPAVDKWGNGSIRFNNTYVNFPSNAQSFTIGGKFTFEFWAYFDTVGPFFTFGGQYQNGTSYFADGIQILQNTIRVSTTNLTIPAITTGSWKHYSLQYDGSDALVWSIDGVGISTFSVGTRVIRLVDSIVCLGGNPIGIYYGGTGQSYFTDFVAYAGTCKYSSVFNGGTYSTPSSQYNINTDSLKEYVGIAATFAGTRGSSDHMYHRTKRYVSVPTSPQVAIGDSNYRNLVLLSNFNNNINYQKYGMEDYFQTVNLSPVVTSSLTQIHNFDNKLVAIGDYGYIGISSDGNYWDFGSRRGRNSLGTRTTTGITSYYPPSSTQFYDIVGVGSTVVVTAPGYTFFSTNSGNDEFRNMWVGNNTTLPSSASIFTTPNNGGTSINVNPNTLEWIYNTNSVGSGSYNNLGALFYANGLPTVGLGSTTPYNWTTFGSRFYGLFAESGKTLQKIKYQNNRWIFIGAYASGPTGNYNRIGITTDLLNIDGSMKLTAFNYKRFNNMFYDSETRNFVITSSQPVNKNSLEKDIILQNVGFNTSYNDTQTQQQFMDYPFKTAGFSTGRFETGKTYITDLAWTAGPYAVSDSIYNSQTGVGPWQQSYRIDGYFKPTVAGIHTFRCNIPSGQGTLEFSFDNRPAVVSVSGFKLQDTYTTQSLSSSTYYRFSLDGRYASPGTYLQYASPTTSFTSNFTNVVFAQAGIGTTGALLNEIPYFEAGQVYGDLRFVPATGISRYTHAELYGTIKGPNGFVVFGERGFVGFGTNLSKISNYYRESYTGLNNYPTTGIGSVIYQVFGNTNPITSGIYTGGKYALFSPAAGVLGVSTNGTVWASNVGISSIVGTNATFSKASVGITSSNKVIIAIKRTGISNYNYIGITSDFQTYTTGFAVTSTTSNFTVIGNTQISTASSAYGGSSAYFDGTSDALSVSSNPLAGIGTGNFTIEGWFNASGAGNYYAISAGSYGNGIADHLIYRTGGTWQYYSSTDGGSWNIASAGAFGVVADGTWAHLAVEKVGTTFRLYRGGVGVATFTANPTYSGSRTLYISTYDGVNASHLGYIQDFRMYNRAKYNSSSSGNGVVFTPPTSYVTAAADTYFTNVALAASFSGTNGLTTITYQRYDALSNFSGINGTITAVGGIGTANILGTSDGLLYLTNDALQSPTAIQSYQDTYLQSTPYLASYGGVMPLTSAVTKYQPTSLNLNGGVNMKATVTGFKYATGGGDFCFEFWGYYTGGSTFFEYNAYNNGFMLRNDNFYGGCGGASFIANQWVHYAIIRSGVTSYYYRNGVLVCSFTASGPSDASLHIGSSSHTAGQYATGYISDLVITMNNTRYSIGAGSSFTPPTAAYNPLTDAYIANVVHYSTFTQTDSTTGYPLYGTGLTRTYNPNPFNGKQINQFVGVDTNIVGIASGGYYAYANKDNLRKWYSGRMGTNNLISAAYTGISTDKKISVIDDVGDIYISGIL